MQPDFTMNDLAAQLQELMGDRDDKAFTSTELCQALSRSQRAIYRLLDEMGDRVEVVHKQIRNRAGVVQTVPAYRLRKEQSSGQPTD